MNSFVDILRYFFNGFVARKKEGKANRGMRYYQFVSGICYLTILCLSV